MVRRHRRFALTDVTLAGDPVGGATVDMWEDDSGVDRWIVRLLVAVSRPLTGGILSGLRQDGHRVHGTVEMGEHRAGPAGRRVHLVELHGQGDLETSEEREEIPVVKRRR